MAKKNNGVQLEGVELKPQVIGYTYKKKGNLGRIIFLLVVFMLVIYYINDISLIVNNWLGKSSASSIIQMANDKNKDNNNNKKNNNVNNVDNINYYEVNSDLNIIIHDLSFNNFAYDNDVLTFDAENNTDKDIDLSSLNLFVEVFDENKVSINSYKIDVDVIRVSNKSSFEYRMTKKFKYFTIIEKSVDNSVSNEEVQNDEVQNEEVE
jgi:hypothetical protein